MQYTVIEQENLEDLGVIDLDESLSDEEILTTLLQAGYLHGGSADDFYIDRDYFNGALAVFDETEGDLLLALDSNDDDFEDDEDSDDEEDLLVPDDEEELDS